MSYPGRCWGWLGWLIGLVLGLSHQIELLLTDGAHSCKAFVRHHQLAVAISQLPLCSSGEGQHPLLLCTRTICVTVMSLSCAGSSPGSGKADRQSAFHSNWTRHGDSNLAAHYHSIMQLDMEGK